MAQPIDPKHHFIVFGLRCEALDGSRMFGATLKALDDNTLSFRAGFDYDGHQYYVVAIGHDLPDVARRWREAAYNRIGLHIVLPDDADLVF